VSEPRGGAVVNDKRERPSWIRGREQRHHPRRGVLTKERASPRSGGVQYGAKVVHPVLEGRLTSCRWLIGEAGAALVEQDQTREPGQPLEERGDGRNIPRVLETDDPWLCHRQVDGAVAHHLVGDVKPVAPRIRDRIRHSATIADPEQHAERARGRRASGLSGMRIRVARCEIAYQGRATTRLGAGDRVILFKTDGSLCVHADKGHKPLKGDLSGNAYFGSRRGGGPRRAVCSAAGVRYGQPCC
jgi:hypothetical protein